MNLHLQYNSYIIYYTNNTNMSTLTNSLTELPKDIYNICESYLIPDEILYYTNQWNKFNKYYK